MVQLIFASFYLSHSGNRLFYLISLLFNGKFLRCTSLIKLVLFVSSLFFFFGLDAAGFIGFLEFEY